MSQQLNEEVVNHQYHDHDDEGQGHRKFIIASKSKRIFASIIDLLISTPLNLGIAYALTLAGVPHGALISGVFLMGAYFIFPTFSFGQTLGKKLMGIMVVPVNPEQDTHNFLFIFLRETIFKYISAIPLGLGYLWFFWQEDSKTWHDMMGGTLVIESE